MRTIVKGQELRGPRPGPRLRGAQAHAPRAAPRRSHRTPSSSSRSSSTGAPRTPTSSRSRSSSTARRSSRTPRRVSHQAGVDEVVDKLERRAVDHREKPRVRSRPEEEKQLLRRIADGTAERRPRAPDRQDEALRDRADVRGGRGRPRWTSSATSSSSSSTPRTSASHPLPARRRRLRADRADHRRRVHEGPDEGGSPNGNG